MLKTYLSPSAYRFPIFGSQGRLKDLSHELCVDCYAEAKDKYPRLVQYFLWKRSRVLGAPSGGTQRGADLLVHGFMLGCPHCRRS